MFDKKKLFAGLLLLGSIWLAACGELEFGVETKVSSRRPDVTVVTTVVADIPENMVLVTVTPSAQATPTASQQMSATPTAVSSQPAPTSTAVFVSPTPTIFKLPTPTAVTFPTPAPAATPDYSEIISFTPISGPFSPGDSLPLTYEAVGDSAELCLAPPLSDQWDCRTAPVSGPFIITIDPTYHTNLSVQLRVYRGETTALAMDFIPLLCPEEAWFFDGPPVTCPAEEAIETAAAYQQFEEGWMLWTEYEDMIYVFFNTPNQTFENYPPYTIPDENAPTPSDTYDPPEGLTVPVSGFGRLWHGNSWVRQNLGWALAAETGYTTTMQQDVQRDANYLYLLDADGRLIALNFYNRSWGVRSQ